MQIASLPKIALVSILASFAFQANACIYWDPHRAIDDPSVRTTSSAKGEQTSSTNGHNVGVYYYDQTTGQSTLTESYYDPNPAAWAYNAGYVVQSDQSFAGASGPNGSERDSSIACFGDHDETPTLPTVTTTAFVPNFGFLGGVFFYRIIGIGGGGGGGGVGVNTVRVGAEVNINGGCYQSKTERWAQANVEASTFLGGVRRGDDFIVRMPNGVTEHWTFHCVSAAYCNPLMDHIVGPDPRINACGD